MTDLIRREDAEHILGRALDAITSGPFDASDPRIDAVSEYLAAIRALPGIPAPDDAVAALQAQLATANADADRLAEALKEFCCRVDAGEVRSRRTYAKFKGLLAAYEAWKGGV